MKVTFEEKVTPARYLSKYETMKLHIASSAKFSACVEILPCEVLNDATTCQTVLHRRDGEIFLKHTRTTASPLKSQGRLA